MTLNPDRFAIPSLNSAKVVLTREADGASWTFDNSDNVKDPTAADRYFNVSTRGAGVANCIIFNPGTANLGASSYEGRYSVRIEGLTTRGGSAAQLSYVVDFSDVRMPINDAKVSFKPARSTYTGSSITPDATVTLDGVTLVKDKDYTLTYTNNVNAGKASVTVTGIGKYKNSCIGTFTIVPKNIDDVGVAYIYNHTYTGEAWEQSPTVYDRTTLKEGTDYTLSYEDNINAGTAYCVIHGKGNYTGTKKCSFEIGPAPISNAAVGSIADQTYTGKALSPAPSLKDGSATLKRGTDYTLSYENNIDAGTAFVTVTGKGNYTGTTSTAFNILPVDIASDSVSVADIAGRVYTGEDHTPQPDLTFGSAKLKSGTDYFLFHLDNVNAGSATAVVSGRGNFTGERRVPFSIAPADIAKATVSEVATQTYTGEAITPDPSVAMGSIALVEGTDYTLSYQDNVKVGSGSIALKGKGNYTGTKKTAFAIAPADISSAVVAAVPDQTYTGKEITPLPELKVGSTTLKNGTDYTLSYQDNVEVGWATITVEGKGNYTGSVLVSFAIRPVQEDPDPVSEDPGSSDSGSSDPAGEDPGSSDPAGEGPGAGPSHGSGDTPSGGQEPQGGGDTPGKGGTVTPGGSPNKQESGDIWKRLAGSNAYGTMAAIAQEGWADGSSAVVIANFDGYWDALAASSLAGKLGAPILLTGRDTLSEAAAAEIARLKPAIAYVVGGRGSVSDHIVAQLSVEGIGVSRFAGGNAPQTAVAIAAEVAGASDTCIIATSRGFHDALAVSPYAYAKQAPIYLTDEYGELSDKTMTAIKAGGFKHVFIAGGRGSVSPRTEGELREEGIADVQRKAGATAVETSMEFAKFAIEQGMGANFMGVATTDSFYDALTGGPLCGKKGGVLVLANGSNASAASIPAAHKSAMTRGYILGGTGSLPVAVEQTFDASTAGASPKVATGKAARI